VGSIDRRLKELEESWYGDEVHLEQLDGSVRIFRPGECWGAVFSACLSLSFKKPDGEVFEALRSATDESREMFLEEFGPIESGIVGRSDEGIWVEVYEYDLDTDEVIRTYHAPGSEEAQAIFEAEKGDAGSS
jgi:hypothetical protein